MFACLWCTDQKDFKRYRRNWIIIIIGALLDGLCCFIGIPSLHQFVTSNKSPVDSNVSCLSVVEESLHLLLLWHGVKFLNNRNIPFNRKVYSL